MLICCSAAIVGFGVRMIIFELLKVFFPEKIESIRLCTARHLRRLTRQPPSNAIAPFVDTGTGVNLVEGPVQQEGVLPLPTTMVQNLDPESEDDAEVRAPQTHSQIFLRLASYLCLGSHLTRTFPWVHFHSAC